MGVKSAKKARKGILNTSSVFDHEDDVEVREILAKQTKQAKDCKIGGPQRTSPATAVEPYRKLVAYKEEEEDLAQPTTYKEKGKLSSVAVLKACDSVDEPQAQGSSPSGDFFLQNFIFFKVSSLKEGPTRGNSAC